MTEEKRKAIVHKWTDNILVAMVGYELMNAAFDQLTAYRNIAVWVLKGNERLTDRNTMD